MNTLLLRSTLITTFLVATTPGWATEQISHLKFAANLSGAQEVTDPQGGIQTDTTGAVMITFDKALSKATFRLVVRDGVEITQGHIHCGAAGVNGPVVAFIFGPDPGRNVHGVLSEGILTNADIKAADPTNAACDVPLNNIASLAFAMKAGRAYVNVHNKQFPDGIVRGQLLEVQKK